MVAVLVAHQRHVERIVGSLSSASIVFVSTCAIGRCCRRHARSAARIRHAAVAPPAAEDHHGAEVDPLDPQVPAVDHLPHAPAADAVDVVGVPPPPRSTCRSWSRKSQSIPARCGMRVMLPVGVVVVVWLRTSVRVAGRAGRRQAVGASPGRPRRRSGSAASRCRCPAAMQRGAGVRLPSRSYS